MYSLHKALVKPNTPGRPYEEVLAADLLVTDLYHNYQHVYLVLRHPAIEGDVYVDMEDLRATWLAWPGTLGDKLIDNADRTLPTVAKLPRLGLRDAIYADAWQAGYKADLVDMGVVHVPEYPKSSLRDLRVWRPKHNTDLTELHRYCLPTVNGFIHDSDTDGKYFYVLDGGRSHNRSHANMLGLWSFRDVGALKRIRIKPEQIRQAPDSTLKDRVYIDVPDLDLDGKSYLMVLGGYVVWADGKTFYRNGEHQFALDLKRLPYESRLHESGNYIRLDSLQLERLSVDPNKFTVDSMWSDAAIKSYLTLSQSFIVIVDTPNLSFERRAVRSGGLAGHILSPVRPKYPLMVGYGRFAEYHARLQEGQYILTIQDGWFRNYQFHTIADSLRETTEPTLHNQRPVRSSDACYYVLSGFD